MHGAYLLVKISSVSYHSFKTQFTLGDVGMVMKKKTLSFASNQRFFDEGGFEKSRIYDIAERDSPPPH